MSGAARPERGAVLELRELLDEIDALASEGDRTRYDEDRRYRWVIHRLWIAVGNEAATLVKNNATGTSYALINHADGVYYYCAAAQGATSTTLSTFATTTATTVPLSADATAPLAIDTILTTSGGFAGDLDAGDVFKVVFNETVTATTASLRVQDDEATDSVGNLNATNATFAMNTVVATVNGVSRAAGRVLTVTVTGSPVVVVAGTTAGIQFGGTNQVLITDQGGIADAAANLWVPTAGTQDVTIEPLGTDVAWDSTDTVKPYITAADTTTDAADGTWIASGDVLTLTFSEKVTFDDTTFTDGEEAALNAILGGAAVDLAATSTVTVGGNGTNTITLTIGTIVMTAGLTAGDTLEGTTNTNVQDLNLNTQVINPGTAPVLT